MNNKIYNIDEIKTILNAFFKNTEVKKVTLFGSYAKNCATSHSDIDLIIDSNGKIKGFKLYSLISKIEELFGKNVDAFEQSEITPNSLVDKEIKSSGVIVYE